jgi:dihydroorotase
VLSRRWTPAGLYVTPGLIDIHVHVFPGLKHATYDGGDWGVYPDGFTFRAGVTTVADAGSSGWRSFEDFKKRIIDTQKTRVLAFLNVVGVGMQEGGGEQNLKDMEVQPAIDMVNKYKGTIVGIKSAHFTGPEWTPYINAEEIGKATHIPVMVDFGSNTRAGRTLYDLLNKYFRPGDNSTLTATAGTAGADPETKRASKAMVGRTRPRRSSSMWATAAAALSRSCAIPLMKAGFIPDSISTDLHNSMNAGMKDMLNVMDKFLAMGCRWMR